MFRVLSQDKGKVTVATMVDYVNSTELFPLTVAQLLDLFDMYGSHNLESSKPKKVRRNTVAIISSKNSAVDSNSNDENRYMRTYELLSFVHKFLRLVEGAITNLGPKFIQKYCIEKMKGQKHHHGKGC